MSPAGWRKLCFVLAAACVAQLWRDCHRTAAPDPIIAPDCPSVASPAPGERTIAHGDRSEPRHGEAPPSGEHTSGDGIELYGVTLPPWVLWLAPHPGEDLRSYRDRMLPLAQAAIAPQRARVARSRDSFAALAKLDPHQRAELDAAAQDTAAALQDRAMAAVMNGELSPATFKPMIGVAVARDLLDIVSRGNRRFVDSLDDEQRKALALHPFDFGDYLVFSTPWETALTWFE